MEVFDLAGPVAAEVGLQPAACRPTRAQGAAEEIIAGGNREEISIIIKRDAGSVDRADVLDFAERKPAGAIEQRIRRHRRAQAPAQGPEPVQIMLMDQGHRRIEASDGNGRIADRAWAREGRGRALVAEHHVALEAGHGRAHLPVVTDLGAAKPAVMLERGAGCEQRIAEIVAVERIAVELAVAAADVCAQVEAGPGPRRDDRVF
jgi:hypothetical protein